jgi:hypothetical protein
MIISIGQGKYNSDCRMSLSAMLLLTNFAYVNNPLDIYGYNWNQGKLMILTCLSKNLGLDHRAVG